MYTEKDFLEEFYKWKGQYGKYYSFNVTKGNSIIKEETIATPIYNRYVPFSFSISQNEVVILTLGKYFRINEEDFSKEYKRGSIFFKEIFNSITKGSLTEKEFYFKEKPVKVECEIVIGSFGNYNLVYNLISFIELLKIKFSTSKQVKESLIKYEPLHA